MPKKSPHPHVSWRNGRPRFQPALTLRAAGHKGRDLRHEDGRWFTFGEAIDWSVAFCAELLGPAPATTQQPIHQPAGPRERSVHPARKGYVYFLIAGDRIKIGFSMKPGVRVMDLQQGIAERVEFFAAFPGTTYDEQRLHKEFASMRTRGEWYRRSMTIIRAMQRAISEQVEGLDWQDKP